MEDAKQESSSPLDWISNNLLVLLITIMLLLILRESLPDLKHRWFAAFMQWFSKGSNVKEEALKKEIFSDMSSLVSHDPEVKKSGGLKILEIGVGTGTNFAYYPEGTHLTVVDPNPHFQKYYSDNRKKFPNIKAEDIIVSTGEDMDMVSDNSMDVVVVTLVFCSVNDTEKMLKQILRVLAPGGKFYFYEHIEEFDVANHSIRRTIQNILTRSGIWPFFFDNCHLNRDMVDAMKAAGFTKVDFQRFYNYIHHPVLQLVKPCLKGVAEK